MKPIVLVSLDPPTVNAAPSWPQPLSDAEESEIASGGSFDRNGRGMKRETPLLNSSDYHFLKFGEESITEHLSLAFDIQFHFRSQRGEQSMRAPQNRSASVRHMCKAEGNRKESNIIKSKR